MSSAPEKTCRPFLIHPVTTGGTQGGPESSKAEPQAGRLPSQAHERTGPLAMLSPARASQLWSQFVSSEHTVQKLLQQAQAGRAELRRPGSAPSWAVGDCS
ncbi:hypothetical protein MC885_020738 [Smutsia gigantea]|nr:hypothetical protein MC885_020738 [Smutsia gigantea]